MEREELDSVPGLAGLYARAVRPKYGGGAVPDRLLRVRDVAVDPVRLRRYAEVCGFPDHERVPITYPHIVAFPLAMSLMTRRDFPFAPPGLVHIANQVERLRPIDPGERLTYEVRVAQPYESASPARLENAKGTAFDVLTEVMDGDGPVWRSAGTYLRRGRRRPDGRKPEDEPTELGDIVIDERWRVPASAGRAYAAVSGDRNPIHLHALAARPFGFRRAIAHGMWTKARCLASLDEVLPGACRVEVTFRAPVPLPSDVRFQATGSPLGSEFVLSGAAGSRVHLLGTVQPG